MASPKRGLPKQRKMRHDRHYVDELAQRMGEGIGRMIRVTSITSNQDQPRSNLGDLSDLVSSIESHGVLEPLLVRKAEQGTYELVSGERRFHAAMQVGLTEVPCIEMAVSDQEALEIALIENLQRQDLSAFEEGEGFRTLIDKYSYTHEQVAKAVGRSRVTVTESLKVLTIPGAVKDACRHADINAKGMLLEIAKAGSEESMMNLIESIVEERLDRAAVRQRRQELKDGPPDGEAAATEDSTSDAEPIQQPARTKPFVWRYQASGHPVKLALSFNTGKEPQPQEVISILENLLDELRQAANK